MFSSYILEEKINISVDKLNKLFKQKNIEINIYDIILLLEDDYCLSKLTKSKKKKGFLCLQKLDKNKICKIHKKDNKIEYRTTYETDNYNHCKKLNVDNKINKDNIIKIKNSRNNILNHVSIDDNFKIIEKDKSDIKFNINYPNTILFKNNVNIILENIERLPGIFFQLYYLGKDYKDGKGVFKVNKYEFINESLIIQNKINMIKKTIISKCNYLLFDIN